MDGGFATTSLYPGKAYERIKKASRLIEHKHFIYTADGVAAIHIEYADASDVIDTNADKSRYLHRDALGSVDTITDASDAVVEDRLGYTPFGKRRGGDGQTIDGVPVAQLNNRGYTGHEHLNGVGLIHMNGRVYDPEIGRFLTHVQSATSSQDFNQYSYVNNNPMKYTDPSGYFKLKDVLKIVAVAALAYFTFGQALMGLSHVYSLTGAMVYGATNEIMTASFAGGFVGECRYPIGTLKKP